TTTASPLATLFKIRVAIILTFVILSLAGAVRKGPGGPGSKDKGHGKPHQPSKPTAKAYSPMDRCNNEILGLGRKPLTLEVRSTGCSVYPKVTVTGAQRTWTYAHNYHLYRSNNYRFILSG
ncbi:hypothetical protein QBC38DRAFT_458907, partial [Podospora fimiseda]